MWSECACKYRGLVRFNCCSIICQFNNIHISKNERHMHEWWSHFYAYIVLIFNKIEMQTIDYSINLATDSVEALQMKEKFIKNADTIHKSFHCRIFDCEWKHHISFLGHTSFRFTKSMSAAVATEDWDQKKLDIYILTNWKSMNVTTATNGTIQIAFSNFNLSKMSLVEKSHD